MKRINQRTTKYDINDVFLKRWSPRALSGKPIAKKELMTIFEAGRWAPSAFNNQPWRFIYGIKGTKAFKRIFSFLGEFNQAWCKNASALVVVISRKIFEYNGKPTLTHSFDTGASWGNITIQAVFSGLVTHGMQGFDYESAKKELHIPDDYDVEMMFAVGKIGKKEILPEKMQENEKPSDRKILEEIVFEGEFKRNK